MHLHVTFTSQSVIRNLKLTLPHKTKIAVFFSLLEKNKAKNKATLQ